MRILRKPNNYRYGTLPLGATPAGRFFLRKHVRTFGFFTHTWSGNSLWMMVRLEDLLVLYEVRRGGKQQYIILI
jgi:hypothetical protein